VIPQMQVSLKVKVKLKMTQILLEMKILKVKKIILTQMIHLIQNQVPQMKTTKQMIQVKIKHNKLILLQMIMKILTLMMTLLIQILLTKGF